MFTKKNEKTLNKPFKDNIRRKYQSWLITEPFEFMPAGKKKAPTCNLVLRWVKDAWQEIPADMVKRSFQSCGISNALDRTKDDAVYTDEMPELADSEDEMEDEFESEEEEDD